MASTAIDNCVCVSAYRAPHISTKENEGKLVINFRVSTAQIAFDETQPSWKRKLTRHTLSCEKTFNYGQNAFLSSPEAQQRESTFAMIKDMNIPFPWENVYWALDFPKGTEPKLKNVDEVGDQLLGRTLLACKQEKGGVLDIRITKWERVSPEKYREALGGEAKAKAGLEGWITENMHDVNFSSYYELIYKCRHKLKSVEVKEEDKDPCAICNQDMKKGKQVIQMPCSHVFHGFCLFRWFKVRPICPLCRFDLFQNETPNKA